MNKYFEKLLKAICLILLLFTASFLLAQPQKTELVLLQTGDMHGAIFSYDFKTGQSTKQGFDRFSAYIKQQKARYGKHVLVLDVGDNLQGQPAMYYYNAVDTSGTHLLARVMNKVPYDVAVVGNHDIEAGHAVYDKLYADCCFPVLAANVIRESTGKPYFQPYTVLERDGFKIAVLGLLTHYIPEWLPPYLWSDMRFQDTEEAAREWVPRIMEQEHPDVLIGLFHTGTGILEGGENTALAIAAKVSGFDLIYCGHDHRARIGKVPAPRDSIWLVNTGPNMRQVSEVKMTLARRANGSIFKQLYGKLLPVDQMPLDTVWRTQFASDFQKIKTYVSSPVGYLEEPIRGADALTGPSAFVDWIHLVQLEETKADVSFAAPLSVTAEIPAGVLTVGDFFSWYPYENSLYVLSMTGEEIRNYLEYSYDGWIGKNRTKAASYNFDSAAGILYTVDSTQALGKRVSIQFLANGKPFAESTVYKVVLNSYRANGGGGHLEQGAGMIKEELSRRVIWRGMSDFRHDLMEWVRWQASFAPVPLYQWRFTSGH